MNILIVTAVYPPEPVVSARLSADLREHLIAQGHEVEVLCPLPSRGVQSAASTDSPPTASPIHHLTSYRCPSSRLIGRLRESRDFGRLAARWLRERGGGFDVIYANMWPIFGPLHLTRAAAQFGIPVVQHVMDVYPESLITKLPGWLYRLASPLLLGMDRRVARRCAASILLSDRIARRYSQTRGVDGRVHVVRNWVDARPFAERHDRSSVCSEYDVPSERFTFMYLGNLSALSGLDTAIRAFATLDRDAVQMVVVGEGSEKAACVALARELALKNVLFRSEPDAGKVARVQTLADAFLLPTRKGGATSSTPSKCISYMLSGKPIVAAVDAESDVADDLKAAQCAWICSADAVGRFTDFMRRAIQSDKDERSVMGDNARVFALGTYVRDHQLTRLVDIVCRNPCLDGSRE